MKNKRGTYAQKVGGVFSRIIFFILLSVCVVSICIMAGLALTQSGISMKNEVSGLTGQINAQMAEKQAVVNAVATTIGSGQLKSYQAQLDFVDSIKAMDDITAAVYVAYPDESVVYSGGWQPDAGFVLTDRIWYTMAAASENVCITEPYVDENTGNICITLSKAVRSRDEVTCVVGMDLYLDEVVSLISGQFNGSSYAFLVTGKDVILAHPNDAYQITADKSVTLKDAGYQKLSGTSDKRKIIWDYSGGLKVMMLKTTDCGWQVVVVRPLLAALSLAFIVLLLNILIFVLSVFLSNRFCKNAVSKWFTPIYSISKKVAEMAEGDLSLTFDEEPITDEIATLTEALNSTITELHAYIDDIRHVVSNVADGNLTVHQHVTYRGDFTAIKEALDLTLENLNNTLSEVKENSSTVADYAEQVQLSTEQVAEGATSQSLSIAGLRDNIQVLSEKLGIVQKNAELAEEISSTTNEQLVNGEEKMQQLMEAMERINETSDEIGSIVGTINELANQTNLLSLNASIEAARAGEAGRGFAVVAEEIGKLAGASAEASNTIAGLIANSKEAVGRGREVAGRTAEVIKSGVDNFKVSKDKLLEITESVEEQMTALNSITNGAEEISSVIETTAAASEENAAISMELIGKSHALLGSVNRFRLADSCKNE